MSIWLKEGAVDELLKLRKDGYSAARIASALTFKFSLNVTRNAVLGKLDRMGLGGLVQNGARNHKRKKLKRVTGTPWGGKSAFLKTFTAKPKKPVQALLEMAPEPLPDRRPDDIATKSFDELDSKIHCTFIPGDPQEGDALHGKKYCGRDQEPNSPYPYCLEHLRRCFQPLPKPSPRPFVLFKPGVRMKEDA